MKGFEKDSWELRSKDWGKTASDYKVIKHKKFPFIKFGLIKIRKGSGYMDPIWSVSLFKWDKKADKMQEFNVQYKKLTSDKLPEIFEELIKHKNAKHIIFNYLFEGNYKIL